MTSRLSFDLPPLVLLAGGLGTRLQRVTNGKPKSLAEITPGRPILQHVLEHWQERGAREVVLCLGVGASEIISSLSSWQLDLRISASIEPRRLGTGGAVMFALSNLPDAFIVANGDTVIDLQLGALWRWHRCTSGEATALVTRAASASDGHQFAVTNDGRISAALGRDSQAAGWVSAGLYVLHRSMFAGLSMDEPFQLEEDVLWPGIKIPGRIRALRTKRQFFDLGTPDRLLAYGSTLARSGRSRSTPPRAQY